LTHNLQAQAESLDNFEWPDHMKDDARIRQFLNDFLHTGRTSFLRKGRWDKVNVHDMSSAANVVLRYHVLDQMVDALSFPRNPSLPAIPKLPFPYSFPDRLARVCLIISLHIYPDIALQLLHRVRNWSTPIQGLRRSFNSAKQSPVKSKQNLELVLRLSPSRAAIVVHNNVASLRRAFTHALTSDLHTVLANVELFAFTLSWFSQHNVSFPQTAKELGQALEWSAHPNKSFSHH
jgi:DNA-binding phage protein